MAGYKKTPQTCEHKYIFLRQEKVNIGVDMNPTYLYKDVFYCERCLQYSSVKIKETMSSMESFGKEIETKVY